jgi:phosphoglycolate phosphatase-like HAD superfamily hydrolase
MSRFHHIRYFVENLFQIEKVEHELVYDEVLKRFSELCRQEYKHAEKTPKFDLMFKSLDGNKAVASGSEQKELIKLFQDRGMSDGFEKILGSPTSKVENVKNILDSIPHSKPVMIGDAVADFKAALENDIDFIGYIPFSNVPEEMINLSEKYDFLVLDKWPILGECK